MGLFKRKAIPTIMDVLVVRVGDVLLVKGKVYRVEGGGLQQLPIKKLGAK